MRKEKKSMPANNTRTGLSPNGGGATVRQHNKATVRDNRRPENVIVTAKEEPNTCRKKFLAFAKTTYHTLGLRRLGFTAVLAIYACFGGLIFHLIEGPEEFERKTKLLNSLAADARNLTEKLQKTKSFEQIYELIREYQINSGLMPPEIYQNSTHWDFWGSMFYAGTLFTTIGYGHYAPQSDGARVATMCYAVIGIPLVLAALADLGRLLRKQCKFVWSYCIWMKKRCWNFLRQKKCKISAAEAANSAEQTAAEEFELPIPIAIALLAAWLLLCSWIFCIWESNWSYFTAFYFFFISLSTIGLGDITPEYPKMLILCFPLVILGLSMVSMVINLIQNKMETVQQMTAEYIEEELGLDETESSSEDEQELKPPKPQLNQQKLPNISEQDQSTSLGVIQTWQKRARRKRRAVQTDESYLQDLTRKFPSVQCPQVSNHELHRSREDVNSLMESLDVC